MDNYDDILDKKLTDLQNGIPMDEVLQSLPENAKDLEGLLRLASAVSDLPHPEPLAETIHVQRQALEAGKTAATLPAARVLAAASSQNELRIPAAHGSSPRTRAIPRSTGLPWKWMGAGVFAAGSAALVIMCLAVAALSMFFSGRGFDSARVENVTGQVQIATGQDNWKNIAVGASVRKGDQIRTLGASSATLVFFEGTHTFIEPNSRLRFLELDGSKGGTLKVKIDQLAGDTFNKVTPFGTKTQSHFLVQTPSGTASVHGTSFNVKVMETGQAQFSVDTGEVRVTNASREVTLLAGQVTNASTSGEIAEPTYQFSISGSLSDIDLTTSQWTVSGLTFLVTETTVISGEPPELSDSLRVSGRILSDGSRVADIIEPASDVELTATFTGTLENKDGPVWMVSGMPVTVTDDTELDTGLVTGTPVKVTFNLLSDNSWLALSIVALVEDPQQPTPLPTATSDPDAMPSYEFDPDELEVAACESNSANLTGRLSNTSDETKDYAANVKLGYLIDRGGEYISSVELSPAGWTRIDAGQTLTFNIRVRMNDAWASAPDGSEIKLRIHIASATNRPDHLNGRLTVTITGGCDEVTPTPDVTATQTLTPTITLTPTVTVTGTPQATPTLVTPTALPTETGQCTGANPHPTGMKLAQRYGVPYEEIMYWFCQHFGFGEIDLAYSLSRQTGTPVDQIFAMKSSGMGWGNIKKSLLEGEKQDKPGKPNKPDKPPKKK